MKPFQTIALLILFTGLSANPSSNLSYGTWVEDSLNISFQYPRAWVKKVERTPYSLTLLLEKNKEAVLRLDTQTREKSWDLDRFIEENVDLLLQKHPNMQIMQERKLAENFNGFDTAHFVLIHYKEDGGLITNRFLFTKKDNYYYVIQSKILRSEFSKYKIEADLFMKSIVYEQSNTERWRNDSLSYLNPANDEATIRFIKESLKQSKWNIVSDADRIQGYKPKYESDDAEGQPKRPIKDVEPGKNPPEGSVEPVEMDSPGPI